MKKIISILLVVIMILTMIVGCSNSKPEQTAQSDGSDNKTTEQPAQKEIKLRAANVTQVDHPMNKAVEFFIEKINEKSNGRIQITNYPARQLGDDREIFEQVQQGSLDIALVSAAPTGSTTELAAAFQLPFMFENWEQWLEVMSSDITKDLLSEFDEFNVKALACYDSGFRNFVSVAKPLTSASDFAGMKIRVAETPLHLDIFRALGASPTPLPYGEIYTSLQNKVIDGLEMDLPAAVMEKHYEVAKNITMSRHFTWPAIFMINKTLWDSFSDEDQQLFIECANEVLAENVEYIKEQEKIAMDELVANGITVTELTEEEKQAFVETTKNVIQEYTSKNPKIKAFYEYVISLK
jgi:tripartite ATP-independent transporter DctP family solute receptor